ncbi:hypothetical protein ARMGADRAFT_778490 [Armillaria gallica]|uniref:Uncharacterized protein n=1 Tax=Armillaria gallica TaxID=47427 RepID=A0A2H3CST5_ARMGA|nr:hypothetical protein ARMGADRAFT_778490 [Armillaria gallica]
MRWPGQWCISELNCRFSVHQREARQFCPTPSSAINVRLASFLVRRGTQSRCARLRIYQRSLRLLSWLNVMMDHPTESNQNPVRSSDGCTLSLQRIPTRARA